jgi:mannose-6-phosphate isomerase-like protein (cupin superfamily)
MTLHTSHKKPLLFPIGKKIKRPWGWFRVWERTRDTQMKEIFIKAGKRLSLQMHSGRAEKWVVIEGGGTVTINGDEVKAIHGYVTPWIEKHDSHRAWASFAGNDMRMIEFSCGHIDENDIVRIEDDYGRVDL